MLHLVTAFCTDAAAKADHNFYPTYTPHGYSNFAVTERRNVCPLSCTGSVEIGGDLIRTRKRTACG